MHSLIIFAFGGLVVIAVILMIAVCIACVKAQKTWEDIFDGMDRK